MSETEFPTPFGKYSIRRVPHRKKETLRAWDAADVYLLKTLHSDYPDFNGTPLIVNDSFAALSVSLHAYKPINWSDSWLSHEALRLNSNINELSSDLFTTLDSVHIPKKDINLVIIKVPKSLALFEYQLHQLKLFLKKDAIILIGGMVKYMPKKVWQLIESIIGSTETLLAVKKAKIIKVSLDESITSKENPYPIEWPLENTNLMVTNHANVFAKDHLDIGTRFFLSHFPDISDDQHIIDLACGSGIIGLIAAERNNKVSIQFIDESYMAIASVKENAKQIYNPDRCLFHCGNGLLKVKKQSTDMILCNPPFHQNHSIGESMALSMFAESARVLKKTGELWIVANRHLSYHSKLSTWFMDVVLIASNKKFVVL